MEKADLFYKDGSSDKEYHCQIEPKGKGYLVNFSYGRRGSTLTTGTKTAKPVTLEEAKKIFDKLVKEKQAKGYSPGESGAAYQHTTEDQRFTGITPQLLTEIDEGQVQMYLDDDSWCLQPKYDGKRVMIMREGKTVTGINRKGLTIGLPEAMIKQALRLETPSFVVDGECIGWYFYAFDILSLGDIDYRKEATPYKTRLTSLAREWFDPDASDLLKMVPTFQGYDIKSKIYKSLKDNKAEGVVFKNLHAPSVPGRPSSCGNQVKYKFYATASFVVENHTKGKHSVGLKLLDGKKWTSVGKVTIAQALALPKVGSVIEVRYLYAYRGGAVYQPIFEGVRDDIDTNECVMSQLKYKRDDSDAEG